MVKASSGENGNGNDAKKESLTMNNLEKIEIESLSLEGEDQKSNEAENVNSEKNAYYVVNNERDREELEESGEENEENAVDEVTHDLTNDIAINQMLADQGAAYNPDAEVFDINQFEMDRDVSKVSSHEEKEPQQESFDYLPYQYQTFEKRPGTVK